MSDIFLSTSEAAEEMGVTSQTIRNWIKQGVITGYQFNPKGNIMIKVSDLERAIEKGRILQRE